MEEQHSSPSEWDYEVAGSPAGASAGSTVTEEQPTYTPATEELAAPAEKPARGKPKKKGWIRRHKILFVILLVVLALVLWNVWNALFGKKNTDSVYQFVRTTTLQKTSLENSVTTSGTVAAGSTASVTVADAAKTYKVTEVNVKVGDSVKTGDVICQLDTTEVLKNIKKAQQDYTDTLQSSQTSYDRAVADYQTAVTQHENNLIDLQTKIDQADQDLSDAQAAQKTAQEAYDSAASYYDKVNGAYTTATNTITTFTQDVTNAENALNNALGSLNNAIANYTNYLALCQTEFGADPSVDPADWASLQDAANGMIHAYMDYNGNTVPSSAAGAGTAALSGNTVDLQGVQDAVNAVSVSKTYTYNRYTVAYDSSAAGVYTTAYARLSDAQNSVSDTTLGLSGYAAIQQALSQAETAKNTANTALEQAKSKTETADQQVTAAHNSYDTEKNSTSLTQKSQSVEDAKTKLTQAQRTPDALTTLQQTLADCTLTATMDGTITALNATVGSVCSSTVSTIQDTTGLTVEITIAADKVPEVKTGMSCFITADTTEDTISGKLTQIDPVANEQGTFGAEVTVTGDSSSLLIGTSAQVEIMESQTDNVFVVPIDAIGTAEDGSSYVLRKTGGEGVDLTFEEVTVTTGASNDYYMEITGDALAEGDVVRSSADLTEGIESSANTQDGLTMMMGGGMTASTDDGGRGGNMGGGTPPSGGNGGGAPGGM